MEALALERKQEQNRELRVRLEQLKKNGMQSFWLIIISVMKFRRLPISGATLFTRSKSSRDGRGSDCLLRCSFHGESAKILAPNKTVLIPDERAGCPMADMVNVDGLRKLKAQHPNAKVVTYINSSAEIKAETDICCTSANAVKVIESLDAEEIIWVPDKNLGQYVQDQTGKKLIIWEGYCNTHDMLTVKDVVEMKAKYPEAEFVVHPECRPEVVAMGDYVGSTTSILEYCRKSDRRQFIVGTEDGTGYQLRLDSPDKEFHFATKFLVCPNMKVNNLKKLVKCLETMKPQIYVPPAVADKARTSLERMLQVR